MDKNSAAGPQDALTAALWSLKCYLRQTAINTHLTGEHVAVTRGYDCNYQERTVVACAAGEHAAETRCSEQIYSMFLHTLQHLWITTAPGTKPEQPDLTVRHWRLSFFKDGGMKSFFDFVHIKQAHLATLHIMVHKKSVPYSCNGPLRSTNLLHGEITAVSRDTTGVELPAQASSSETWCHWIWSREFCISWENSLAHFESFPEQHCFYELMTKPHTSKHLISQVGSPLSP